METHEHHGHGRGTEAPGDGARQPHAQGGHGEHVASFRRRFWVSLALTVPVLALDHQVRELLGSLVGADLRSNVPGASWIVLALSTVVFGYGGWPFLRGFVAELRGRSPGMMTLISVAISTAYVYSVAVVVGLGGMPFFWELTTLIDVMLLGHWLEMRSVLGASRALESLVRLMPDTAHRVGAGGEATDVPLSALAPGDRVLVKPGEKVPLDGVVVEGRTTLDQAMLTGESRPVERGEGDLVIGGSINGEGALVVEVHRTGRETYLAQVIDLVRRAQESRSRTQDLASRAALALTVAALAVGSGTFVVWLALGESASFALTRAVTVMVIACPHALGLAVPLVVAISTAISARRGLLIRDRSAFERARDLDAVLFDKTGTLTEGRFGVTDVIPLGRRGRDEVLALAASLESQSEHPIARGIVQSAADGRLAVARPGDFSALPGQGARAVVEGLEVKVVSPGYLAKRGLAVDDARLRAAGAQGKTVVFVLVGDQVEGAIALADLIRSESREALARLRELGIRAMMITGDAEAVARWVAGELGLDEHFAEVLPHEKAAAVEAVQRRGLVVAMVGDGVNDAPALTRADVGIAIGAGTDVAIESADVVLVRSDPRDVAAIVALARATYRKMVQNLWWAAGYNIVAIPLAAGVLARAGVLLSPALGAVLMAASTIIVAINARRLRVERDAEAAAPAPRTLVARHEHA